MSTRGGDFYASMRSIPSILLPVLLATTLAATETRVYVTADHANLRYQNADTVEVARVVSAGQVLVVIGPFEGKWVPVVPPDDISVWIYAELVRKGQVVRDKAQVRSGPGLDYKVVGSLEHGTPVESRGRVGDWMKIKSPAGLSLWVNRAAIAVAPVSAPPPPALLPLPPALATGLLSALTDNTNAAAAAARTAETAAVAATEPPPSTTVVTGAVVRVLPPPELADLPLAATPLQGRRLRFTGILRASTPGATAAPNVLYRISGPDRSGGIVTFCHVLATTAQFDALPGGAKVTIEGPAWWMKGESVPVVQAEKVSTP